MALVDYSSESGSSTSDGPPPKKRPKRSPSPPASSSRSATAAGPALPPLPPAFHDLYASTVRTTISDDPALHQGRTRQNPHVVGNWPSHIYIEWNPSSTTQSLLTSLLSSLQKSLPSGVKLSSFLTSDLGAPLPLHISLSRPLALTTANKDAFLSVLSSSICNSRIAPFTLRCRGVEWHHTEESGRSFLVLRVRSTDGTDANTPSNPELTRLLLRCNSVVDDYGQPQLYQWALEEHERDSDEVAVADRMSRAFHVSIAWTFTKPTEELMRLTDQVFEEPTSQTRIQQTRIHVDGIKAKIGNLVTHIPLGTKAEDNKWSKKLLGL
jgi:U6 snRNA phosphodiesterase